jgi:hypothetical protein
MDAYSLRRRNFALSLRGANRLAFGDAVSYEGRQYYWEPRDHETGFLYRRERHLGDWARRSAPVEAQRCERLPQDRRFRVVRRGLVAPIELQQRELSARVHLRFLYGKTYLKALRTELRYCGLRRGRHRVYLAEMTVQRLTSKKIDVIRKLAFKSRKHKCFLLIGDRPTRPNYQADPALFAELATYLGRHSHCALFSWNDGPSAQQLAALVGMIAGSLAHGQLAVPEL